MAADAPLLALVRPGAQTRSPLPTEATLTADLCDGRALQRAFRQHPVDLVVHCAAEVPKAAEGYTDSAAAERNLAMCRALHRAMPAHTAVLNISSMAVYGAPESVPWTEAMSGRPDSAYGQGKWHCEVHWQACRRTTLSLRLPGLFGPARRGGVVFNAVQALRQGTLPPLPTAAVAWAAVHVDDAAQAVTTLCAHLNSQLTPGVRPPSRGLADAPTLTGTGAIALHFAYDTPYGIDRFITALADHFRRPRPLMVIQPVVRFDLTQARRMGLSVDSNLLARALLLTNPVEPVTDNA